MTKRVRLSFAPLLLCSSLAASVPATLPSEGSGAAKAMQVLKANCVECHNPDKRKAGLLLTNRESALEGGESGVALVPGKPKESPLMGMLLPDADPHMPPKKQLSAEQIRVLRTWIEAGAQWDDAALAGPVVPDIPVTLAELPDAYQPALTVALTNDGQRLAVGRGNRVTIYEIKGKRRTSVGQIVGPHDAVQSLAWSADGQWLAAGEYRRIWIWDARTLMPVAELTDDLVSRITALEFTPDSNSLLAADGQPTLSGIIHLWDMKTRKLGTSWTAHKDTIFGLKVSRDGLWLATSSADKLAKLWEIETGEEIGRFEGHTGHVLSVAFNHETTLLATGSADREVKIWDIKTKQKKINLKSDGGVTSLAWTPDGKSLVAVSDEGTPKIFTEFQDHNGTQRSVGAQEKTLKSIKEMLYSVATIDAKAIYAGCHDGSVYVWGNDDKAPVKLAAANETNAHAGQR